MCTARASLALALGFGFCGVIAGCSSDATTSKGGPTKSAAEMRDMMSAKMAEQMKARAEKEKAAQEEKAKPKPAEPEKAKPPE